MPDEEVYTYYDCYFIVPELGSKTRQKYLRFLSY